jgi:endonuclease/exonuclease/phosphatase family metal-dependent hydrolase
VCNGYLGAANDCLGNKGFLMARLALPNGAELDVWNTHLDAGRSEEDHAARVAQLDRLAAAIEHHSAGRALLVGGDFNLEWDDPRDRALLESFCDRLGLAIAAQTPPDGWESHLDYLLLRSGDPVHVDRTAGGKDEKMLHDASTALSDHPALFVRARIE